MGQMVQLDVKMMEVSRDALKDIGLNWQSLLPVNASVNLLQGETLVLAELLSIRNVKRVEKVPLLGSIPIIGELFKSRAFQDARTEFLVFVTPTIVRPGGLDERKVQQMKEHFKEAGEDIGFSLLD